MRKNLPVEGGITEEVMGALPADWGDDEGEVARPVLVPRIKSDLQ